MVEEDGYRYDNVAPGSGRDLDAVVTVQSQFNVVTLKLTKIPSQ